MRPARPLVLVAALSFGMALPADAAPPSAYGGNYREGDRPAPPPAYGGGNQPGERPAPPPAYGDNRPTPPSGSDAPQTPVQAAYRTANDALERFSQLEFDLVRAHDDRDRDMIEVQMMDVMGEALESLHQSISPRQGATAERIYRIVEPAYKKAWLQRYEWKQEGRPERKRERLKTLNRHLRDALNDVKFVSWGSR